MDFTILEDLVKVLLVAFLKYPNSFLIDFWLN